VCYACGHADGTDDMLVCDDCGSTFHNNCLINPLSELPRGEWRCPKCVARVSSFEQILCIVTVVAQIM